MYSAPVRLVLLNPVNGAPEVGYNYFGECEKEVACRTNPARKVKNKVKFCLLVNRRHKILEARWEIFGDPVSMATASWCVSKIKGLTVEEALYFITLEKVVLDLELKDELDIRAGCMTTLEAVKCSLKNYLNR